MQAFLFRATLCFLFISVATIAVAQPASREFPVGKLKRTDELPAGHLRARLEKLPGPAQQRALQWLRSFHFTESDLPSLRADSNGAILYVCDAAEDAFMLESAPAISEAAVPVSPLPATLVFHSKPGAPNVLYLNFSGENVVNTDWNTDINRSSIPAVAFSTDSDLSTFSDAEQLAIKRIWQRVAEDYAPFNIDVTTERPSSFTSRTAHAIITRSTDANGELNPYSTGGGVAYVNVFGTASYAKYRPAWIYHNNLGSNEGYVAEATSHEVGHNFGLSHDGLIDGANYYGGHGSGDVSWGPLMGTGYNRNVSQWSKGEYYMANNSQDDLAIISGKLSYRTDDHGNSTATATALVLSGGTNIVSTTSDTDVNNTNIANKGVLERNDDVDVFSFSTGSGTVNLSVKPSVMSSGPRGGNLDVSISLYNEAGALLFTNNPATQTSAQIQTSLAAGKYYLHVRNSAAGAPFDSGPSGYTSYGSIGQYFISGNVATSVASSPPTAVLQAANITQSGQGEFTVTYSDNSGINVSSIDSNDIRITGPNGYDRFAQFVSVNSSGNGTPRVATYFAVSPSVEGWSFADNGNYKIWMRANQVSDTEGAWIAPGQLGGFQVSIAATAELVVAVENPERGTVNPTNGTYVSGSSIQIAAIPATFYRFKEWTGGVSATNNPLTLQLNTNLSVLAVFDEILTTNNPTPLSWLASHGMTNNFETAVNAIGANGIPLWQSFIAGLQPNDPASQLRLDGRFNPGEGYVLQWNPVAGRVYTVWSSTNLLTGFAPVVGASELPWTIQSFTNPPSPAKFFRLQVEKP